MKRDIEKILYKYYGSKNRTAMLQEKLIRCERDIEQLKKDIQECNINMKSTLKGIDYTQTQVSGGIKKSSTEREFERAFAELEQATCEAYRIKHKLLFRIRELNKKADDIEIILNGLDQAELSLIEMKYKEELSCSEIAKKLYCSTATVYRKREKLLKKIAAIME